MNILKIGIGNLTVKEALTIGACMVAFSGALMAEFCALQSNRTISEAQIVAFNAGAH